MIIGTALIRAMTYIMQLKGKVDVINMSYGEHSQWSNAGKIGELIGEVVNKHGVIWAVSAGNAGNIYFRSVHIFFSHFICNFRSEQKGRFQLSLCEIFKFFIWNCGRKKFHQKKIDLFFYFFQTYIRIFISFVILDQS